MQGCTILDVASSRQGWEGANSHGQRPGGMPAKKSVGHASPTRLDAASLLSGRNRMVEIPEALVFDYDGVIADTEPLHWKSWALLLAQYGIQLGWDEYCRIGQGVSDTEIFEHFRSQMPPTDAAEFSRRNQERKQMVRAWSLAESPIPQETVALLKSLGAHRIGLVTSSDQAEVEPVLRAAQIYNCFDATVFGEEPSASKPSPAPYLLIAERLGVRAGVAFEDSEPGLASAQAAGFRAVKIVRPSDLSGVVALSLR